MVQVTIVRELRLRLEPIRRWRKNVAQGVQAVQRTSAAALDTPRHRQREHLSQRRVVRNQVVRQQFVTGYHHRFFWHSQPHGYSGVAPVRQAVLVADSS